MLIRSILRWKTALALKRSCNFSRAKIERINTVARHVLLHDQYTRAAFTNVKAWKDTLTTRDRRHFAKPIYHDKIYLHVIHILLSHWGRVTDICVSKLTIIGSDNGLSPGRCQAIIWTNAGILLIRSLGTNSSKILSEIHTSSFKKMPLKMSSTKWR